MPELGHLTSEVRSGGFAAESITYGYDAVGNRISQSGSNLNGTFSYNADDELTGFTYSGTSYASATFGYDANGQRTSETTGLSASGGGYLTQYGYDFEGNLTGITAAGNGSVSFGYDALDRQLGWQSGGSRLDYQLDGNVPLTETNSTSSKVNLWGNGLVSSGGETLLPDGVGATRGTTNTGQGIQSAQSFTAFGLSITASGSTANPYQWGAGSGYRSDGFGPTYAAALTKVGARYYDPEFGCFLSRDTDLSQSPYAYCDGDPVNYSDPSGHLSAVNIAAGAMQISGMEDGSENAPVDTTGDNTSSNNQSSLPAPSGSASVPDGNGGTVTAAPTSGGGVNVSDTNGNETINGILDSRGNLNSVGESGKIPLSGELTGFGFTFGGSYNLATGVSSSSVGLTYSHGGFMGGISTNGSGVMIVGVYKGTF